MKLFVFAHRCSSRCSFERSSAAGAYGAPTTELLSSRWRAHQKVIIFWFQKNRRLFSFVLFAGRFTTFILRRHLLKSDLRKQKKSVLSLKRQFDLKAFSQQIIETKLSVSDSKTSRCPDWIGYPDSKAEFFVYCFCFHYEHSIRFQFVVKMLSNWIIF